jgi:uncharacterized protein (DUF58 family)
VPRFEKGAGRSPVPFPEAVWHRRNKPLGLFTQAARHLREGTSPKGLLRQAFILQTLIVMKNLYISNRFFALFGVVAVVFAISYALSFLFPVAIALFELACLLTLVDAGMLFNRRMQLSAERRLPRVLSLSDANAVGIAIENHSERQVFLSVIDELPEQFQKRDFGQQASLRGGETALLSYELRPVVRGEYHFGHINVYVSSRLGLLQRRFRCGEPVQVPVFPSVVQMKKYQLQAFKQFHSMQGLRRIRRIGHSYEFEQIKNYVRGDDYRSLNWKATGRANRLMVNQYEDERSQQVYCLIDKSRAMKMPFAELSLMDYAINASLALSNIVLRKHDKAGLITFSDVVGTTIKADNKPDQLHQILEALYREKERPLEANFELLYHIARKLVNGRSLLLLFTNFESWYALERVLPMLRRINHFHLLVVVFFENTEIRDFADQAARNVEEIYTQTVARNFLAEKSAMAQVLLQHGIQTVLTRPEELSMNTINKYLELKSRGFI